MKKLIALFLSMLMILSMGCAMATENVDSIALTETLDIKIELPEGYEIEKERQDTALYAVIYSEAETNPMYLFSIAYEDLAEGPTPGEMTEEDIQLAKEMVGADFFNPTFSVVQTGGGTKFLVINENDAESDYVLMIANYNGYFVQMFISPAVDAAVTEADINTAVEILTSIELLNAF